jgi:hypothetical protein
MDLTIQNANTLAALDHKLVGVAVKILAAGGSRLSGADMARAAGATDYWWRDNNSKARRLVKALEIEV